MKALFTRNLILILFLTLSISAFAKNDSLKVRKMTYNDFITNYSINDTSAMVVELFFDKKDNSAISQMSFLPLTLALYLISPTISIGTTLVSFPLFVHGSYMLVKYRKKRLLKVLIRYKETGYLPKGVRKKANKLIDYYESIDTAY